MADTAAPATAPFVKYTSSTADVKKRLGPKGTATNNFDPNAVQKKTTVVPPGGQGNKLTPIVPKNQKQVHSGRLRFPYDVDSNEMQRHYILFYINQQLPAFSEARKSLDFDTAGTGGNYSITLRKKMTTRTTSQVAMYMPPQINVSSNIKFAEADIGMVSGTAVDVASAIKSASGFEGVAGAIGMGTLTGIGKALINMVVKGLDVAASGSKAVMQIATGSAMTPHMELMFEGVTRREFNYTFTMTPRNVTESNEITKIIKTFRQNMHPNYIRFEDQTIDIDGQSDEPQPATTGITRYSTFPNTFDIQYMYKGKELGDTFLHKIKTCYLTKCDVTYGSGDRYISVGNDGAPAKVTMVLGFSEIEVMTRAEVAKGY